MTTHGHEKREIIPVRTIATPLPKVPERLIQRRNKGDDADSFDWDAWIEVSPGPRKRGAEVLNRLCDGLSLSPREEAIVAYADERSKDYREIDFPEDTLARVQIDLMGTFLCAAEDNSGKLAEIAKLSDVRPEPPEVIK